MSSRPSAPPTSTLICRECNFENEQERVYCHNCGAKLDRSILPPEIAARRENPAEVQRRLKRMTNPRRGSGLRGFKNLLVSLLTAALLAGVALAFLPPRDKPQLPPEQVDNARLINSELDEAVAASAPRRLVYSDDLVNAYLQSTLRPKKVNAGGGYGPEFRSAFVHFLDNNVCRVTQEQSLFGLPIHTTVAYALTSRNGHAAATPVGGGIGRLPLPGIIMPYVGKVVFGPLFTAAQGDLRLLGLLGSASCRQGQVEMTTRPAGGG